MNNSNFEKCPICGKKLYKNSLRNGKQRWRCSSKACGYNFTEDTKVAAVKQNALLFFYNLMKNLSAKQAKLSHKVVQNVLKNTQYKSASNYNISIEDFTVNTTINANSFIIEMDKNTNELKLLSLRYCEDDLIFKRKNGRFNIKKYVEPKKEDVNKYNLYPYYDSRQHNSSDGIDWY